VESRARMREKGLRSLKRARAQADQRPEGRPVDTRAGDRTLTGRPLARSVGVRSGLSSSPLAKKTPRIIDDDALVGHKTLNNGKNLQYYNT